MEFKGKLQKNSVGRLQESARSGAEMMVAAGMTGMPLRQMTTVGVKACRKCCHIRYCSACLSRIKIPC